MWPSNHICGKHAEKRATGNWLTAPRPIGFVMIWPSLGRLRNTSVASEGPGAGAEKKVRKTKEERENRRARKQTHGELSKGSLCRILEGIAGILLAPSNERPAGTLLLHWLACSSGQFRFICTVHSHYTIVHTVSRTALTAGLYDVERETLCFWVRGEGGGVAPFPQRVIHRGIGTAEQWRTCTASVRQKGFWRRAVRRRRTWLEGRGRGTNSSARSFI